MDMVTKQCGGHLLIQSRKGKGTVVEAAFAKDLKNIRDYIAEDNEEYAAKTIKEIYGKFENSRLWSEAEQ